MLGDKSFCVIKIDANDGVARVTLDTDRNSRLGIEYKGAQTGDVITVKGGKEEILVYNANPSGRQVFKITFSGATQMALTALGVAASTLLALF